MGVLESIVKDGYWTYTIYDKRDGSFVCCGVDDTMDGAERTAREVLSRLKYKKHYGIVINEEVAI